jgi:hypothetical protein
VGREDNVSLYLTDRMLELAEALAQDEDMPLKKYLTEALKYIILAHGQRLGRTDKYIAEFKNVNSTKVSTWRPLAVPTPAPEADSSPRAEVENTSSVQLEYPSSDRSDDQSDDQSEEQEENVS